MLMLFREFRYADFPKLQRGMEIYFQAFCEMVWGFPLSCTSAGGRKSQGH